MKLRNLLTSLTYFLKLATGRLSLSKRSLTCGYYVPKIIYISGGLFTLLSLVLAGWYMTAKKLDEYKANDTKYR